MGKMRCIFIRSYVLQTALPGQMEFQRKWSCLGLWQRCGTSEGAEYTHTSHFTTLCLPESSSWACHSRNRSQTVPSAFLTWDVRDCCVHLLLTLRALSHLEKKAICKLWATRIKTLNTGIFLSNIEEYLLIRVGKKNQLMNWGRITNGKIQDSNDRRRTVIQSNNRQDMYSYHNEAEGSLSQSSVLGM